MSQIYCPYEIIDLSDFTSGRIPQPHDPRTIMLTGVLRSEVPALPKSCDWTPDFTEQNRDKGLFQTCRHGHRHFAWGSMRNRELRNCTIAAAGHIIQAWTSRVDHLAETVSDDDLLNAYYAVSEEKPGGKGDRTGSTCLKALSHWRKKGIGNHRIHAFVGLRPGVREDIMSSIYMFGAAYVGMKLPEYALKLHVKGGVLQPWQVTDGTENPSCYHAVCAVRYTEDHLTVVTWGIEQRMTWDFYEKYCDEAYGVLSKEWIAADGTAPNHIHAEKLEACLNMLSIWGAFREADAVDGTQDPEKFWYQLKQDLQKYRGSHGEVATEEVFNYLAQLAGEDEEAHAMLHLLQDDMQD